jgi:regulator of RNase E activity RraB
MSNQVDQSVSGDDDTWMLFERLTPDSYPLVMLARTGNLTVDDALTHGTITVVRCQADVAIVNDRGMPQHTDRIYQVEDGLARELGAFDVRAYHVASITGDGERRMVYVHEAPLDFDPLLQMFRPEGYSLSASVTADRAALIDLMTPTAIDRQLSGDMDVISNLEKNGDDGTTPRKTDFWFYGERSSLERIAADLAPWGYTVDHWLDEPEGVVLTSETAVDFGTFGKVTPVLVSAAEKHGATYDGWETFVVSTNAPAPKPPVAPQPQSLLSKLFGNKKN